MINRTGLWAKVITGTTSATPGTVTSHAHGLKYAPNINWIFIVPKPAVAGNANNCGAVGVTASDTTNIDVKCSTASQPFAAVILPFSNEPEQAPAST